MRNICCARRISSARHYHQKFTFCGLRTTSKNKQTEENKSLKVFNVFNVVRINFNVLATSSPCSSGSGSRILKMFSRHMPNKISKPPWRWGPPFLIADCARGILKSKLSEITKSTFQVIWSTKKNDEIFWFVCLIDMR